MYVPTWYFGVLLSEIISRIHLLQSICTAPLKEDHAHCACDTTRKQRRRRWRKFKRYVVTSNRNKSHVTRLVRRCDKDSQVTLPVTSTRRLVGATCCFRSSLRL